MNSEKFDKFSTLLMEWNAIHNLTGAKNASEIFANIEDSIYPTKFIDTPSSILDVGTGAGFPGLILAIYYPNARVVLCEPRNKRASFLKFVAIELELNNVNVVKKRVEEYKDTPFELISSRAVTNTKILLDLTYHLQNSDTKYLFYKGEQLFNELEIINTTIDYDIITQGKRNYLYIKKVQHDT
ncbi:MAG: 16S rRNA (guanine(527)-N(7))-methyltransferase RsmG [Sulfurovaceae bacterium]|nr:16S rRNA (guanine(527)-N(7))-methyltransferase RsmG [Sulfurovaceae bacterium]